MADKDTVAVIGGGPGGYVAAIRLAQLGKKVTLVEKDEVGGVCLNSGCIPSKTLIAAATLYDRARKASELGIVAEGLRFDLARLQQWKQGVVRRLAQGIQFLLKHNRVQLLRGLARFAAPRELEVDQGNSTQRIRAEQVLIATGSRPIELPGFRFDGKSIMSSREALELTEVPRQLAIIGGGVIGLEIGIFYAKLGSQLTIVELTPGLLPGIDRELVDVLARKLKKNGSAIHLESSAKSCAEAAGGVRLDIQGKSNVSVDVDKILVAVGVRPVSEDLGLERIGVRTDPKGFIQVNERLETSVPGIFAIGDATGGPLLAHKASKQGMVAAEVMTGKAVSMDVRAMPAVIFTDPEIATVGMSEEEARKAGHAVRVGKFPFMALGRAISTGETEGFVKIISEERSGAILGAHIVGSDAGNLIAEPALALEMGATVEDLALTVHAHPTLPEGIMEAAEAALGRAIHMVNR